MELSPLQRLRQLERANSTREVSTQRFITIQDTDTRTVPKVKSETAEIAVQCNLKSARRHVAVQCNLRTPMTVTSVIAAGVEITKKRTKARRERRQQVAIERRK